MVVCASYEYSRVKDREDPFTTHVAKWNDSQPTGKWIMINYENPDASHIRTHENSLDFIGGVTIPIKETPTDGFETLYFGIIPYLKGSFACALISKFVCLRRKNGSSSFYCMCTAGLLAKCKYCSMAIFNLPCLLIHGSLRYWTGMRGKFHHSNSTFGVGDSPISPRMVLSHQHDYLGTPKIRSKVKTAKFIVGSCS